MRCGKVRRNLMAYHDGELGMAAGRKVARHLGACKECSGLLAALERGDHAAGAVGVPAFGSPYWDTFTGRVMERVRDEALSGRERLRQVSDRRRFSPIRLAPALSVTLVVVVAAGVLLKIRHPVIPEPDDYGQEAVAGRGIPSAPEERPRIDLEMSEAADLSEPEQKTPEPASEGDAMDRDEDRRTAPGTSVGSAPVKKEAADDERERLAAVEKEAKTRFTEKDDPVRGASPPPTGLESGRSFMTEPPREPAAGPVGSVEMGESLPGGGNIDDGSWGQLAFARRLDEEGRHVESEKVLEDLLARDPSLSVREQASILLVDVLAGQNRLPEARQVLEEAQRQYPENAMIQSYRIENGE